jgi:hypothetical protein
VTTKVKGLGYYSLNTNSQMVQLNSTLEPMSKKFRIFDTADYVIPPNEYNAIFIMTNFIETIQTIGNCDAVCFRNLT